MTHWVLPSVPARTAFHGFGAAVKTGSRVRIHGEKVRPKGHRPRPFFGSIGEKGQLA